MSIYDSRPSRVPGEGSAPGECDSPCAVEHQTRPESAISTSASCSVFMFRVRAWSIFLPKAAVEISSRKSMTGSSEASRSAPPDSWSSEAYKASSSFVPRLTTKVTQWFAPQAHQRVLDLGCGDGVLTATLKPLCAHVTAIDSSPNLIAAARKDYGHIEGIEWIIKDCRDLDEYEAPTVSGAPGGGGFDQVFSNAALHWILRDPSTRLSTLRNAHRLLKPGGTFVFEMGGPGNVAEIHAALLSALLHRGIPLAAAREACPWYFPSEAEMKSLLEGVGFTVDKAEVEYRPTRLTEGVQGGGLPGWVRLHGDSFLKAVPANERDGVVHEVCDILDTVIGREGGEGGKWVGYVRLRVLARKSSDLEES